MANVVDIHRRNHRQQLYMLLGASSVALLLGAAPRNARALFVFGAPQQPKAFAAIVAPPGGGGRAPGDGGLFARSFAPRAAADPGITAPVGGSDFGPIGGAFNPAAPRGGPLQLAAFTPDSGGPGGSQTSGPLAGSSAPAFAPAAPATNSTAVSTPTGGGGGGAGGGGSATNPGGGTTTSPGGGTTTSPTDPVAPVPEPAAWLTMILGFFGLGALLRHTRRAASVEPKVPTLEGH